jgi:hypothetical protein
LYNVHFATYKLILNDFDSSAVINDIHNHMCIINDYDGSGVINIIPDIKTDFNKFENLTVSHTFNFIN